MPYKTFKRRFWLSIRFWRPFSCIGSWIWSQKIWFMFSDVKNGHHRSKSLLHIKNCRKWIWKGNIFKNLYHFVIPKRYKIYIISISTGGCRMIKKMGENSDIDVPDTPSTPKAGQPGKWTAEKGKKVFRNNKSISTHIFNKYEKLILCGSMSLVVT